MKPREFIAEAERLLITRADPEKAAGMAAYMQQRFEYLGVQTPIRVEIIKPLLKSVKAVADETMRGFGVPASRIEIVPNGVDEFWSPGARCEGDYLLYAGTLEPRKGVHDLIAAWWSLPEP